MPSPFLCYFLKPLMLFLITVGEFCSSGIIICQSVSDGMEPWVVLYLLTEGPGKVVSVHLFINLFYQDLIQQLNSEKCGIIADKGNYNVFCYANDILLSSTTPSGLQKLFDKAVDYITMHSLRFNPAKTTCLLHGITHLCIALSGTSKG